MERNAKKIMVMLRWSSITSDGGFYEAYRWQLGKDQQIL